MSGLAALIFKKVRQKEQFLFVSLLYNENQLIFSVE